MHAPAADYPIRPITQYGPLPNSGRGGSYGTVPLLNQSVALACGEGLNEWVEVWVGSIGSSFHPEVPTSGTKRTPPRLSSL